MSLKKFISRRIVSVVIIISIVFIGVITNLAKTNMDKAVINTTLSEMNQIGVQIETSLEQTLKESKNDLLVLSEYISIVDMRSKKRLVQVAYYDSLTNLPNIMKLSIDIVEKLKKYKNKNHIIIVFDIENFKALNEMYGREIGDRVLKSFKIFFDRINDQSLVTSRIGDDKFAVFGSEKTLNDLDTLFDEVVYLLDERVPELIDYAGTYKIGRYNIENGETNFEDIMTKVNLAHQKAKTFKGQLVCDYDDTFKKKLLIEGEIISKMNNVLENKEFKVFLQPKFDAHDNTLVGAEALVRWIEDDSKMISVGDFIPLFERYGFIVQLDRYVFENTCMTIRKWMDEGLGAFPISVNCSRLNLENPNLVADIITFVDKYNVPHECIEIELTESITISNENSIDQLFKDLHHNGFRVSIDDFGAGYSSLGLLKNLHVDTLKMDRSFFINGNNARRDDILIDSIIKMSHNLGMYVVAEGIETQDQLELLRTMNCDAIQGYLYARPMPINEFEKKYSTIMLRKSLTDRYNPMIIKSISDAKFANSLVSCGILIIDIDANFTILEANDYYFKMIGYTREEVRDIFDNSGLKHTKPERRSEFLKYFEECISENPYANISFKMNFTTKNRETHTFQLNGKIADNEHGFKRLYVTVTDITSITYDNEL